MRCFITAFHFTVSLVDLAANRCAVQKLASVLHVDGGRLDTLDCQKPLADSRAADVGGGIESACAAASPR